MSRLRNIITFVMSPVFVLGAIYWTAAVWFDLGKDWVLEINGYEEEKTE